uniref:Uncharacterized protein n=1 Tax=Knipowitschia caucasica TaxID=637954 RepID=A0AAV2JJY8_KNICA
MPLCACPITHQHRHSSRLPLLSSEEGPPGWTLCGTSLPAKVFMKQDNITSSLYSPIASLLRPVIPSPPSPSSPAAQFKPSARSPRPPPHPHPPRPSGEDLSPGKVWPRAAVLSAEQVTGCDL